MWRNDFPIFTRYPHLAYLDNAATTQKPAMVIDRIKSFYDSENANIHRGLYPLASKATANYELVRDQVSKFIGAKDRKSICFTSGTTTAINLVCQSFLLPGLNSGDHVIISAMEHHANLIPWQQACRKKGAELRIIPMSKEGVLDLNSFRGMISDRTRMVAVVHVSNTLGTENPIDEIITIAHQKDIPVLIDGAQSVLSHEINVHELDCDFFAFSAHKMFGPTGIGVLYGKLEHLHKMQPVTFGGEMIKSVSFDETTFADYPRRFEAGTPNIAGVIGLGAAVDYIQKVGRNAIRLHQYELGSNTLEALSKLEGVKIFGNKNMETAIISFTVKNVHPHDVATMLADADIAVRAGHHCTQPIMDFYGIPGTVRVSFSIYNSLDEIERLKEALVNIQKFFA